MRLRSREPETETGTETGAGTRAEAGSIGFTLVEVMIALAILAIGLVLLIGVSTAQVRASQDAKMLTIVAQLARGKMLDVEEELLHGGFQEMAETMDGDFSDEGWPKITWKATIEKVELPGAGQLQGAASAAAEADKERSGEGEGAGASTPLAGFLGGAGGDAIQSMGAAALMSQFELVKNVLENAIRKVTLEVAWKVGAEPRATVVTCYFTDPKAVDAALGGQPPPGGGK